jgi:L-ribulose-5-phosphate 3-epimerase
MEQNLIAVNLNSYRKFRDNAFEHLAEIGVRHVEIPVPTSDDLDAAIERLRRHGLWPSSLICRCDLSLDPETMREQLSIGNAIGVELFFVSAKCGGLSKPEAYQRLRARAELADEYAITLCLETHPDLAENATEARATVHAVGHSRLRWNLDTANLHYYNQNVDAISQAQQGLDLIASVHLKDSNGGYKAWWFPALGDGVVDFPRLFELLNARGFYGPFTLELEGIEGEELDEQAVRARVARSLRYLRVISALT